MNKAEKLEEMIKGIKFGMLTMPEADGTLRSRPMTTLDTKDEGVLWFFAGASSSQAAVNPIDVNLSYSDTSSDRYISISGTAQIVRDSLKTEELWKPMYKAWFPQGVNDPDLALLKLTIRHSEYWDTPVGKMVQFLKITKAAISGKKYVADPAEHERVS